MNAINRIAVILSDFCWGLVQQTAGAQFCAENSLAIRPLESFSRTVSDLDNFRLDLKSIQAEPVEVQGYAESLLHLRQIETLREAISFNMKAQSGGPPPIRTKVAKRKLDSKSGHRVDFFSEASRTLMLESPALAAALGASAFKVQSEGSRESYLCVSKNFLFTIRA